MVELIYLNPKATECQTSIIRSPMYSPPFQCSHVPKWNKEMIKLKKINHSTFCQLVSTQIGFWAHLSHVCYLGRREGLAAGTCGSARFSSRAAKRATSQNQALKREWERPKYWQFCPCTQAMPLLHTQMTQPCCTGTPGPRQAATSRAAGLWPQRSKHGQWEIMEQMCLGEGRTSHQLSSWLSFKWFLSQNRNGSCRKIHSITEPKHPTEHWRWAVTAETTVRGAGMLPQLWPLLPPIPACSHISSAISCKQHKYLFWCTGELAYLTEDQLQRNDIHCTGSDMAKNRTILFRGSKPLLSIKPTVK